MRVKTDLTETELGEVLRPKLLLFLSVDLQGSSRLKQEAKLSSESAPIRDLAWLPEIFAFFKDFGEELERSEAEIARFRRKLLPMPRPWKILGDEILYVVELAHRREAALHLTALARAISARNKPAPEKKTMPVKGSAWIAGFPVANTVVPLEDGGQDYLGASMDTGFRLGALATPRMMALSADLTWLLLAAGSRGIDSRLFYDGRRHLKGIGDTNGYPLLLFDTGASSLQKSEDHLIHRKPCDRTRLKAFCEAYILEQGFPRHLPFISSDSRLSRAPASYNDWIDGAEALLRRIFIVTADSEPPASPGGTATRQAIEHDIQQVELPAPRRKPKHRRDN